MIQCDICQVANEDVALFCKECGGRLNTGAAQAEPPAPKRPKLKSPLLAGSDDDYPEDNDDFDRPAPAKKPGKKGGLRSPMLGGADNSRDDFDDEGPAPAPPKPGKKGGLRSPILGGGGNFDDDDFEEERPAPAKKGKGGLRSPILGGGGGGGSANFDDDDDDLGDEPVAKKGKGGLRSPILGGGGGGGTDRGHHNKHDKHEIEFPHRSHDLSTHPSPQEEHRNSAAGSSHRGLRSPLLGGDDSDFEEMPSPETGRNPGGASKSHRLRSPILGGAGDDFYDEEEFEEESFDDGGQDPTALRSPLLAARTPKPKAPPAPAPAAAPMPAPAPIPAPAPPAAPMPAPAPVSQVAPPAPMPAPAPIPNPYTQQSFNPNASQTQMPAQPQAPTGAPRYQPQPAPSPTNSHYRMSAEQTLVQLQAIPENQRLQEPGQHMASPAPAPTPSPVPPAPAPVPVAPAPAPAQSDTTSKKLRSRLLSDGGDSGDSEMDEPDFHGPADRRMRTDRRAGSGTGRRFRDSNADNNIDDEDVSFGSSASRGGSAPGAAGGTATIAMGLVFAAFGAKVWLFMSYPALLTTSTQITVDQLASAIALIGTLWLAFNMTKKS